MASFTTEAFTIEKQGTAISLTPPSAPVLPNEDAGIVATLTDATGEPLRERTVFFVVTGSGGTYSAHGITNYLGQVPLGPVPLGPGTYDVKAYFNGTIDLDPTNPEPHPDRIVTLTNASYEPSSSVTVSLIHLGNTPPVAGDDYVTTDEDVAVTFDVLGNDHDPDGSSLLISTFDTTSAEGGNVDCTADGQCTYTPPTDFSGTDTFTYRASDGTDDSNVATVTITVNPVSEPLDCSTAEPSAMVLWPPDKDFWPVNVLGVTNPNGGPVTITILSIYQDERVGKREDGRGVGTSTAWLRAERDGNGDGRVYHISFIAANEQGDFCTGELRTAIVPHDYGGGLDAIDGGALYNSTIPD
jgi:hypothetical protein